MKMAAEKKGKRMVSMHMGPEIDQAEELWPDTVFISRAELIRATLRENLEKTAKKYKMKGE